MYYRITTDLTHNCEGYRDMTAYLAIHHIEGNRKAKTRRSLDFSNQKRQRTPLFLMSSTNSGNREKNSTGRNTHEPT